MTEAERRFMKQVDKFILNATPEDLQKIQKLDVHTQLNGNSFYDILATSNPKKNQEITSKSQSSKKKNHD